METNDVYSRTESGREFLQTAFRRGIGRVREVDRRQENVVVLGDFVRRHDASADMRSSSGV
jgi:DNA helicase TIP49 (TBP-interacting protein)